MESILGLTAQQALTELQNNQQNYRTAEQLKALADRVSVYSTGGVTVLYGGSSGINNVSTVNVVDAMNPQGLDTRNINKTEIAELLSSEAYKTAVANAFNADPFDASLRNPKTIEGALANNFINNAVSGEWARASDRFAMDTKGDVRILSSFATDDRTLNLVELGRAMDDPGVAKINGIDKVIYQKVYDTAFLTNGGDATAAQTALLESVKFSSSELLKDFRISGTGDALKVGTGDFLKGTGVADGTLPAERAATAERFGNLYASVGDKMTPSEMAEWGRGAKQFTITKKHKVTEMEHGQKKSNCYKSRSYSRRYHERQS